VATGRALIPRAALALLAVAALARAAAAAGPCGATLAGAPRTVEDARYTIAYVTVPDPVVVGAHFVVDFAVCPRAATPVPQEVRIDATMPEHRHGMNYRPVVSATAAGVYRAEGMLFHMPGRWDLAFDVVAGTRSDRLTSTLRVE
jgi:hypothetical protein